MRSLSVLYQDDHLVAVNKPAGLLVHRSAIDRHESDYAMQIVRDQLGRWVYLLHRLDKSASGVLLFALDKDNARRMTELFIGGTISKSYLAVVRGWTKEAERIDHPLRERRDKMTDQRADPDKPAQDAMTDYIRLATVETPYPVGRYPSARFSLIKASPLTGRNHQIRRHMKHVHHPIIGDTTYGDGKQNDFFRTQFQCRRMLLHAREIAFTHPQTGRPVRIAAPLDSAFNALLTRLAWDAAVTGDARA